MCAECGALAVARPLIDETTQAVYCSYCLKFLVSEASASAATTDQPPRSSAYPRATDFMLGAAGSPRV
jgi:hypothetical protein